MTTAGNDTASTREDELLARVYQQAIGAQAAQYAAAYDAGAGLARFGDWLRDHAAAGPEPGADQMVARLYSLHYRPLVRLPGSRRRIRSPTAFFRPCRCAPGSRIG